MSSFYSLLNGGDAAGASQSDIKRLQRYLNIMGYYNDTIDGYYGPNTEKALRDYKQNGESDLTKVSEAYRAAETGDDTSYNDYMTGRNNNLSGNNNAQTSGGSGADTGGASDTQDAGDSDTKRLQTFLKENGYYTGDIDGLYGPLTESAVAGYKEAHHFSDSADLSGIVRASESGDPTEIREAYNAVLTGNDSSYQDYLLGKIHNSTWGNSSYGSVDSGDPTEIREAYEASHGGDTGSYQAYVSGKNAYTYGDSAAVKDSISNLSLDAQDEFEKLYQQDTQNSNKQNISKEEFAREFSRVYNNGYLGRDIRTLYTMSSLTGLTRAEINAAYVAGQNTAKAEKEAAASQQEKTPVENYVDKSMNQILLGNYTDDVTALGTLGQMGLGFLDLDLPGDIRDVVYDVTHWESTPEHIGQTALDLVGVVPVIGALKYVGEAGEVAEDALKSADKIGELAEDVGKNADEFGEVSEDLGKYLDEAVDDGADGIEDELNLGRSVEDAGNAVKALKPQDLMDELAQSGVKYNPDDVVMVTKTPDGKLLWLENGNSSSGLQHIIDGHADDFANKGINDIPDFLNETLQNKPVNTGVMCTPSRGQ